MSVLLPPAWAGPETLPEAARGSLVVLGQGTQVTVEGRAGIVRLSAIQFPDPTRREKTEPSASETKAYDALRTLLEGHQVSVRTLPVAVDRAGRTLAHLIRDDGLWIEAELVRTGMARVAPTQDTAMFAPDLLAMEDTARTENSGFWAEGIFKIREADDWRLGLEAGTYQIVEGRVLDAVKRGDNIYLNFGADYRTDFTVTIPRAHMAAFTVAGIKPLKLTGQKVRVRGWISQYRGPAMEVTIPAALEVLK